MGAVLDAREFVNDGPARVIAVVVDAGDIEEEVEAKLGFGGQADLGDVGRVSEGQGDLAAKLGRTLQERGETIEELTGEFLGLHGWSRAGGD
jgi:hypothetical protein